ncbi:MAG: glycosyl hydrolase family 18 protein [Bacteroidota bacterium]
MISVSGWTWSGGFSDEVFTASSREKFANSAVAYLIRHNIDGIDLDWEYPGLPGNGNAHRPEDRENFSTALKLLREKLDSLTEVTNKDYLLPLQQERIKDTWIMWIWMLFRTTWTSSI